MSLFFFSFTGLSMEVLANRRYIAKRQLSITVAKNLIYPSAQDIERSEVLYDSYLYEIDSTLCDQETLLLCEWKRLFTSKSHLYHKEVDEMMNSNSLLQQKIRATMCRVERKEIELGMAKNRMKETKIKYEGLYKRKREWYDCDRDRIARLFHFDTPREEIINRTQYHLFCQLPDVTLIIMSYFFGTKPITSTGLEEAYDNELKAHKRGVMTITRLLSTCHYLYSVIGKTHYNEIQNHTIGKTHCLECMSRLSRCDSCNLKYCQVCSNGDELSCDECEKKNCDKCAILNAHQFQICNECGTTCCRECDDFQNRGICDNCEQYSSFSSSSSSSSSSSDDDENEMAIF